MEQADVESRCRLCFSVEDLSYSLFPPEEEPRREVIEMILECTSIRITLEEDYPSKVCEKCLETLDKFYQYRQRCQQNDRILKSQRGSTSSSSSSSTNAKPTQEQQQLVQVKQEPEHYEEQVSYPAVIAPELEQRAQPIKQEDPGGSSILRSILLQNREPERAPLAAQEPEQKNFASPQQQQQQQQGGGYDDDKQHHEGGSEPAPASLLQQMLLQQSSVRDSQSPAQAGPSNPNASPSLLKRMLMEGGGRQSPLEGPSTMNHKRESSPHELNHNKSHSETPLTSQLRAILMQHRAAAAAIVATTPGASSGSMEQISAAAAAAAVAISATNLEKQEVSYFKSLFRRDSDSDSEAGGSREVLFNMLQELRARSTQTSEEAEDSEECAFDYRVPSVRRRSSESTDSRKRFKNEFNCILCGRVFLKRSKLVIHMRTHVIPASAVVSVPSTSAPASTVLTPSTPVAIPSTSRANSMSSVPTTSVAPNLTPIPSTSSRIGSAVQAASNTAAAAATAAAITASTSPVKIEAAAAAAASNSAVVPGTVPQPIPGTSNSATVAGTVEDDEENRQIDLLEKRSYACYICNTDQTNLQQLREHLSHAHQDRIRSRGRARERTKAMIYCKYCNRQFRSQFAYGEHMRIHTGERPFTCNFCNKRFPRRYQLLGHLFSAHKQEWATSDSRGKFCRRPH
ncbi:protein sister of odd and bowel-like [Toxorhynchites rutilus septentrionalis]|uniref:protein sister of odd and bowel-like n=1 Tax=Toxorhynchites rutilus septentrionalis TaxID=329112 RepID=UPI002479F55A|nr:protein sister of odd and bowel-like [Toxorhynchites rutilus septentrionalis]